MAQKFLNNFESTFVAAVKDSAGTATPATELDYGILRLSDGAAAFLTNPGAGDFYVLTAYKRDGTAEVNQEIMKVTAVDNTQPGECRITVERGQEGTTVRSYLAGDRISLRLTAGAANNWVAQFDIAKDNANTATNQANIATSKADIATTKADNATAQADRATNQADSANSSRIAAQDAAAAAAASYDSFDDRYLGSKSADPTLDNDGAALIEGALYWNSTAKEMRTWNGTAWVTTSAANAVSRGGDTMTGALSVPAGASGTQVPRAEEVVPRAGNVTMTGPLSVPAGASGAQVPQAQEVGSLANAQMGMAGQVAFFARNSAPTGWLKANGTAVSRTTYAALFAAIGTTFGAGDGSTTFNVPDLRGEFPRGWDDGRGVDSDRVFGSAQSHAFASHTHTAAEVWQNTATQGSSGATLWSTGSTYYMRNPQLTTAASGGTETRPRNIALLACIKF